MSDVLDRAFGVRDVTCMVRPHRHYRALDAQDGSLKPFSTVEVSRKELNIYNSILVEVGTPEHAQILSDCGRGPNPNKASRREKTRPETEGI